MLHPTRKDFDFATAPQTFNDALSAFDLNWNVDLRPVLTANQEGELKVIPGYKSVNRLDTDVPLAVVGSKYVPVQHRQMADMVDEVVKGLNCRYVNGGLFGAGERVFLQAQFPTNIQVKGVTNGEIKKYLVFLSSHNSSLPAVLGGSNTVIICQNTFMMALKDARRDIRIRHTSNAEVRLTEAKDILKAMLDYHAKVELRINQLAATRFTDAMMAQTLQKVFEVDPKIPLNELPARTKNSMNKILDFAQSGLGIDANNRGTAWSFFNAATQWSNYEKVVKNEKIDPMARTESLLLGSGMQFNLRAQQAIEEVAGLV